MEFLSGLALVLLTLVGYSSGVAIAGGDRHMKPVFWDLVIVVIFWVLAFATRETFGEWGSIFVWLIFAMMGAMMITRNRLRHVPAHQIPDSELPEHARTADEKTAVSDNIFVRAWESWKIFAEKMGNVQGRMIMGFFYFIIVTPFGLGARIFSDPLAIKKMPDRSGWVNKEPLDTTLETAREQG